MHVRCSGRALMQGLLWQASLSAVIQHVCLMLLCFTAGAGRLMSSGTHRRWYLVLTAITTLR
jgi:hypothetical protein